MFYFYILAFTNKESSNDFVPPGARIKIHYQFTGGGRKVAGRFMISTNTQLRFFTKRCHCGRKTKVGDMFAICYTRDGTEIYCHDGCLK